jgi:hypothetical protein
MAHTFQESKLPAKGKGTQPKRHGHALRGVVKNKNNRLMKGVKMMEQNRKPQKPMRRFLPAIPATKHNAK